MNKKSIILISTVVFAVALIIFVSILYTKSNLTADNLQVGQVTNNIPNDKDVVLTITSHSDVKALTLEDIEKYNYCIVIGKLKTIDGSTNFNPVRKEYTSIMSYGTLEITQTLIGSFSSNSINVIKPGGIITLSEYEKGLTTAQKQKQSMQTLLAESASTKDVKYVEEKDLDAVEPIMNSEYLFVMYYNSDYGKYMLDTYPDVLREVKRENGKIYLKNNITNQYELFTNINELFD